jgi:hypothetical protein
MSAERSAFLGPVFFMRRPGQTCGASTGGKDSSAVIGGDERNDTVAALN